MRTETQKATVKYILLVCKKWRVERTRDEGSNRGQKSMKRYAISVGRMVGTKGPYMEMNGRRSSDVKTGRGNREGRYRALVKVQGYFAWRDKLGNQRLRLGTRLG